MLCYMHHVHVRKGYVYRARFQIVIRYISRSIFSSRRLRCAGRYGAH